MFAIAQKYQTVYVWAVEREKEEPWKHQKHS